MFCSLSFNKNVLVGINISYIAVSFLLIGVAAHGKSSSQITSLPIIGGIIACGVFLLIVALLGAFATYRQSQSLLFYYMIILGVIFILQFSISCACLGVGKEKEMKLSKTAWDAADVPLFDLIHDAEQFFQCCGYDQDDRRFNPDPTYPDTDGQRQYCIDKSTEWKKPCNIPTTTSAAITTTTTATTTIATNTTEPTTTQLAITTTIPDTTTPRPLDLGCQRCQDVLDNKIEKAFNASGGLGLFFALTEFVAIVVAYIYRKQCASITTIT